MRYRKLDKDDDYSFGRQQKDFWRDQPEAVGQAVETRLQLQYGEWWLDKTDGTPHMDEILGENTAQSRDPVIQMRILGTRGVQSLDAYYSQRDEQRVFRVTATITTIYGQAKIVRSI